MKNNTEVFEWYVVYENVCFNETKLPEGDENEIPALAFYKMLVEASNGEVTLDQVMKQADKMGYAY